MKEKLVKIQSLNQPVDFLGGKTFLVLTLSKADVEPYFSKAKFRKLKDEDMSYIAEKLGNALMDIAYWDCLEAICEDFESRTQ